MIRLVVAWVCVLSLASALAAQGTTVAYERRAPPPAAGGPIDYVADSGACAQDTANSVSVSMGVTPTAGNSIYVACMTWQETLVAGDVTDDQGQTYTLLHIVGGTTGGGGIYRASGVAGVATSVTCAPGGNSHPGIGVMEVENDDTPDGAESANTGNSAGATAGSVTAANMVIGAVTQSNGDMTLTPDQTQVCEEEATGRMPINLSYSITSGAINMGWTLDDSDAWFALAVSATE